jgi:hypothetical protein
LQETINGLQFSQYCEYEATLVLEAKLEKDEIDAIDSFQQKLAAFKQKYPDKAERLNFSQINLPQNSLADWKQKNLEKSETNQAFLETCGVEE